MGGGGGGGQRPSCGFTQISLEVGIWYFTWKFSVPLFYKFCPNLLNGRIDEDRARRKQSL